jgi:NAD+ diphosphatase
MSQAPFKLCPACGKAEIAFLRDHELRCTACGFTYFHNVAAAVGVFLLNAEGRALFLRRGREPKRGLLGLPGGFVDPRESLEEALRRECREEIGREPDALAFLGSFSNRYEFKGIAYNTCDAYFVSRLSDPNGTFKLDPIEASACLWLSPAELHADELAFESLQKAVKLWRYQG